MADADAGAARLPLGARLAEAREARRLSQQDVADLLRVTRVLVSHWERDERRPSEPVLERLAQLYGIDLATLFDPGAAIPPSDLVDLLYRDADEGSIDAHAQAGLRDFVRFLDSYVRLLDAVGEPVDFALKHSPFSIKRGFTSRDDVRRKSEEVRNWLGLGLGPIVDLPGHLDDIGVTLYRTALGSDLERSVSGAFLNHPRLGFCIVVNLETTPGRQTFTMAHELAHALFHSASENRIVSYWGRRDDRERFADAWAGEFLVPYEGLRRAAERLGIRTVRDAAEVVHLQRHFGVSYAMMLLRLLQTRQLDDRRYDEFQHARPVALAARLGYDLEDDEWSQDATRWRFNRFPRRFVRMLTRALRDEVISPPTAAGLMDLTLDEITEVLEGVDDDDPEVAREIEQYGDVRQRATG